MSSNLNESVSNALDQSPDPENDAMGLFHYLMERFGWSGTVMTRNDAETLADRELTDEEWERVSTQKAWTDAPSVWNEDGITWECVHQALMGAGIEANPPW